MVTETDLTQDVRDRLTNVIQKLASGSRESGSFGTFTPVCYDTAWVAMVTKPVNGKPQLLFPDCFSYLLRRQTDAGGWGETNWPIDALLNSLATLLCLVKHRDNKVLVNIPLEELDERIERAKNFISSALAVWDVEATIHVGFEILVPALLGYLSNHGIEFTFPGRELLMNLNTKKLAKFDARYLYTKHITTLVHSLEAFIGIIDFNKVKHHLRDGAMLGSPAATAVYLMHADTWDDRAEAYLRRVNTNTIELGGIPSAFPSPIFESSWALSAFLSSGIELPMLIRMGAQDIVDHISNTMKAQNGIVGFAADMLVDADDTAKCLQVLSQTQNTSTVGPESMISEFNSGEFFRTFRLETSPSFSANCNVLLALLAQPDPSQYATEVAKSGLFLLEAWEAGPVVDKWNLSPLYSYMLFSQIISILMMKWDEGQLGTWTGNIVQRRFLLAAVNILGRLLPAQGADGSWSQCTEQTAYAVLTLSNILRLPLDKLVQDNLAHAISQGRSFLLQKIDSWSQPPHLWVEKVSYGSPVLSESYCIAAVISSSSTVQIPWSQQSRSLFEVPQKFTQKMAGLSKMLPLSKSYSKQELHLPITQSYCYLQRLLRDMPHIFPQGKSAENKYLAIIPFAWVLSNHVHGNILPDRVMWDMMRISVLNFQADEYMESTLSDLSDTNLNLLEHVIRQSCGCVGTDIRSSFQHIGGLQRNIKTSPTATPQACDSPPKSASYTFVDEEFQKLRSGAIGMILGEFVSYVLNQLTQRGTSESMHEYVSQELCGYLLAQIHHIRENASFSSQDGTPDGKIKCFTKPRITYHDWVNTVASDDTSCPFSFAYFCCLVSKKGSSPLPNVESQYLAKSLGRHLAVMCRQYNDYGSLKRDIEEDNLNGLNFPEFSEDVASSDEVAKQKMMKLAAYERKCLNLTLEELGNVVEKQVLDSIKTFVDVTDLFGELYLIKDLQNKVK